MFLLLTYLWYLVLIVIKKLEIYITLEDLVKPSHLASHCIVWTIRQCHQVPVGLVLRDESDIKGLDLLVNIRRW